jgi:peptidoglycan/xylan/chitin deacetylase (PgdA/CDA1 family)
MTRIRASLMAALCPSAMPAARAEQPPQYVVISFDGAGPIDQWERSRALARQSGAHFTYFLSCVYLLSPDTRQTYAGPKTKPGKSNVGFAQSRDDVAQRLQQIWTARLEGHEIASHGCGHFDGKDWSTADWRSEFDSFTRILRDAWTINGIPGAPDGWRAFAESEVKGFRAPYLSTGKALDRALAAEKFRYDASGVSRGPAEPVERGGIVRFSLPLIPEGPKARPVIAMDYNLFVRHSDGVERPDEAQRFEERAYDAFIGAFERQYEGDRVPLQLGFHFTLMNDAAYWRALERFAGAVCAKPDVRCVSYGELADAIFPQHTGALVNGD